MKITKLIRKPCTPNSCGRICPYKPVMHIIEFENGYQVEILRHCKSVGGNKGLFELILYYHFKPVPRTLGTIEGNLNKCELRQRLREIANAKEN